MKLGLSTYSLVRYIQSGQMSVPQVIEWVAANGGEHVEIVPIGFSLVDRPDVVEKICNAAASAGIDLSNYAIGANFLQADPEAIEREVERVITEVDVANALGVKRMRHDVAWVPIPEATISRFERVLPQLVESCRRIADHAAQYGIITSVENHGYFVQASDRVARLVDAVDRPNFRTTLDVGNFMCADEDSVVSVTKNLPIASMVHLKDFYLRRGGVNPGEGWFQTAGGNFLRGAIVGHGDIDMPSVIRAIKASGYDGYISIEFEGLEDGQLGSRLGLANARRMWEEA